jgi:deoxyribonuclease-4
MLIGAHVSTAGGLSKAIGRGVEIDCDAIQIFNQSPRMWRPTAYGEDDFAEFREQKADSQIESVIIHAVYLINCATPDAELREKSLASLTQALRIGDGIGAAGVVLHPGARKDDEPEAAIKRAGEVVAEALAETESCPVLLEQMAGHKGVLGATLDEVAALVDAAGAGDRVGICLDSCHLFASGYDVSTPESLGEVLDEVDEKIGLDRLRALHINDSKNPLGSRKDRHANLGEGDIGADGMATFLSEPRFEGLPATLEVPGSGDAKGPVAEDVATAKELRRRGLAARA